MDGRWNIEQVEGALGEMFRLTLRRMFETAIGDGTKKFALEQKVPETRRVDADIAALPVRMASGNGQVALFSCGSICSCGCGGSVGCLEFLVRVVDEIFFVRHVDRYEEWIWMASVVAEVEMLVKAAVEVGWKGFGRGREDRSIHQR